MRLAPACCKLCQTIRGDVLLLGGSAELVDGAWQGVIIIVTLCYSIKGPGCVFALFPVFGYQGVR